jgi:hypothetical protein
LQFYHGFEEYITMSKWFGQGNVTHQLAQFTLWANGPYPLIIHMYDRGRAICASVSEVYPPLFPINDVYTHCFFLGW